MIPEPLLKKLQKQIAGSEHPRELAVDVMYALQHHYGYLSDEAVVEGAGLLGMTPLELEELATFYDFIYREPVGKYVIHVCDSAVCWMFRAPISHRLSWRKTPHFPERYHGGRNVLAPARVLCRLL